MPLPAPVSISIGRSLLLFARLLRVLSGLPLLGALYRAWLCRLVWRSGLFDERFYRENNRDLSARDSLLLHYALTGDGEGRCPSACFDPTFYRLQAKSGTARRLALPHYLLVGRHQRLSPSAWFDADHYLRENKDVARARLEPLRHFLTEGAFQGRTPSSAFDSAGYLRAYPDVQARCLNPLLHYICEGRFQGRQTRLSPQLRKSVIAAGIAEARPQAHWVSVESLLEQLDALPRKRRSRVWPAADPGQADTAKVHPARGDAEPLSSDSVATRTPLIDVVVPIYRGRLETLRCLLSLLTAQVEVAHELVVINDASPDEVLCAALRKLAAAGLVTLIEQSRNQGFVKSANLGLRLHPDRDVLLLNADTEVYDGWLDRLHRGLLRQPKVGTLSPLSNNATICSYPQRGCDNPYPLELEYRQLDALAAEVNSGISPRAPTTVGFCMYLRRACLDAVGLFDEAAFSPGYGEENDFSQRASSLGWEHRIAADVFVRHWGARSFRGEKGRHSAAAKAVIAQRYPDYRRQIAAFDAADPLALARRRLDWGRLLLQRREENVLILHHRRGGGSAKRVAAEISALRRRGLGVFVLRPVPGDVARLELSQPEGMRLPNLPRFSITDSLGLTQLVARLRISEIQTHGLFDLAADSISHLERLVRSLGLRWVAYLHDYKVICPRVNLVDRRGRYCGERGEARCRGCLALNGSEFGRPAIAAWRAMHARALTAAALIRVPDQEVAERIQGYFPMLRLQVSAHDRVTADESVTADERVIADDRLARHQAPAISLEHRHVVVIGAIGQRKGFGVLLRCARDARARGLGLRFTLLGFGLDDARLKAAGVAVSGRYQDADALGLLKQLSADLIWLPSTCPETFSYTLSLALRTGLPICAFDLGAIAARLRRLGITDGLLALSLADRPAVLNQLLIALASGMPTRNLLPARTPSRLAASLAG